jgi:hypothetical protein
VTVSASGYLWIGESTDKTNADTDDDENGDGEHGDGVGELVHLRQL